MNESNSKRVINIQGGAQGPVQGDHNIVNQHFYDRVGREWNKHLVRISDLRLESFKLGDTAAARFPYIVAPIQEVYDQARRSVQEVSGETSSTKHGIIIFGESNSGKTRLALEVLKQTLPMWPVLRWRPDYTKDDIPPIEFLDGKHLVLFIDDLQDYTPSAQRNDPIGQFLVNDPRTIALRTLIETLLQSTKRVVMVTTCRTEDSIGVQATLSWLLIQLANISVPSFNPDIQDSQSAQVIAHFQKQSTIQKENILRTSDWDGTLGSLVLGLSTKRSQYLALSPPTTAVLHAMKLLTLAKTFTYNEQLVRVVCADVFGEKALKEQDKLWQEAIKFLTQIQFLVDDGDSNGRKMVLNIRKDIYFEQVITGYPSLSTQIFRDFVKLQKVFSEQENIDALFNLGQASLGLELYVDAFAIFEQITRLKPDFAFAYISRGVVLALLGRFEGALANFEQAIQLDPTSSIYVNKGEVLIDLGREEEALLLSEQAIQLDPNNAHAYACKGDALHKLGRIREALEAFEQAIQVDPTFAPAYNNKGYMLKQLRRKDEAFDAFKKATELNPSFGMAFVNLGNMTAILEPLGGSKRARKAYERGRQLLDSQEQRIQKASKQFQQIFEEEKK